MNSNLDEKFTKSCEYKVLRQVLALEKLSPYEEIRTKKSETLKKERKRVCFEESICFKLMKIRTFSLFDFSAVLVVLQ